MEGGNFPFVRALVVSCALLSLPSCSEPSERVILATTTSVEDTGLLDTLTATFQARHPQYVLSAVAVGTGMVLEMGRRQDADVLVTHDSVGEMEFVEGGYGHDRRYVMENYFIIVGPPGDPAGIRGGNALRALRAVARREAPFVSRADDSGTHRRELRLWREAGVEPTGSWYIQAGVGMGDALLLAGQKHAYILTDRATYTKFKDRIKLDVMIDGDPPLLNTYSVIVVSGANNETGGKAFADWLVGAEARKVISSFGAQEHGQPLFFVRDRANQVTGRD